MDNKAISSDLIRGHIDTIILYSLIDGQKTSQQIIDSVAVKSDNKYQLNQATLYSSLKRLESLKFISSLWHDAEDGRRKFFTLTESGKSTVNNNLSNWEYSRAIIDRLIGFNDNTAKNATRVVEVEKIVEKPVYIEKIIEKPVEPVITAEKPLNNVMENALKTSNTEINFRNILNGLIKNNEKEKADVIDVPDKNEDVKNFNETINTPVQDSCSNTINKIDFSDLKEKVETDGYKLSVSSKEKNIRCGSVLINKLNLYSTAIIALIALLEFLVFSVATKDVVDFTPLAVILSIVVIAALPITFSIMFFKKPLKTSGLIKKDGILYSAIVAFNLILFTIVLDLLFNVNFADSYELSVCLIIPLLIILDLVLFFTVRFYISKMKLFTVKNKQ